MDAASTVNQVLRMIRQEPRYLTLERGTSTAPAEKPAAAPTSTATDEEASSKE
jgi:hypothetical protein